MRTFILIFLCFTQFLIAETGLASWYGGKFQGRPTANGEIFDTYKMTAAHKTLPFGTRVKVTNISNGKSTIVRINDRGPFIAGRIIDLSKAAAKELDMLDAGVTRVEIEILKHNETASIPVASIPKETHMVIPDGVPVRKTIQVSSFRNTQNALKMKHTLAAEGIAAALEFPPSGHTRVIIPSVREQKIPEILQKLKTLGYGDVLIRER